MYAESITGKISLKLLYFTMSFYKTNVSFSNAPTFNITKWMFVFHIHEARAAATWTRTFSETIRRGVRLKCLRHLCCNVRPSTADKVGHPVLGSAAATPVTTMQSPLRVVMETRHQQLLFCARLLT